MEDRTFEFLSLARAIPQEDRLSQQSASITSTGGSYGDTTVSAAATGRYAALKSSPAYTELKTFHKTAAGLSKDIAATSHMLAQLTQLVKQTNMFHDDAVSVNDLVVRIKTKIENLNSRLDEAGHNIAIQKRRLGRNSQAGQEASNLVGQLQEEFGQAAAGFKKVLQARTEAVQSSQQDQKMVYGGMGSIVSLDNKPPIYGDSAISAANNFPTLDLTTGMSAGESTTQLPRPREYRVTDYSLVSFIYLVLCFSHIQINALSNHYRRRHGDWWWSQHLQRHHTHYASPQIANRNAHFFWQYLFPLSITIFRASHTIGYGQDGARVLQSTSLSIDSRSKLPTRTCRCHEYSRIQYC